MLQNKYIKKMSMDYSNELKKGNFFVMKSFKKKEIKNSNGITLIALVITIIVLLILAGISIGMLSRRQWNTDTGNICKVCKRSK